MTRLQKKVAIITGQQMESVSRLQERLRKKEQR